MRGLDGGSGMRGATVSLSLAVVCVGCCADVSGGCSTTGSGGSGLRGGGVPRWSLGGASAASSSGCTMMVGGGPVRSSWAGAFGAELSGVSAATASTFRFRDGFSLMLTAWKTPSLSCVVTTSMPRPGFRSSDGLVVESLSWTVRMRVSSSFHFERFRVGLADGAAEGLLSGLRIRAGRRAAARTSETWDGTSVRVLTGRIGTGRILSRILAGQPDLAERCRGGSQ